MAVSRYLARSTSVSMAQSTDAEYVDSTREVDANPIKDAARLREDAVLDGQAPQPIKDMTVSDVGATDLGVDGQVADMGPAECGNGIVESGEACDDGNVELERCEAYNQTCMVCGPQCELVEVYGPACGDGIHQMNER